VSREVAKAIADTGRVNGPIFTIENGIDLPLTMKIKKNVTHKNTDLLIAGIKHPEMAALLDKECGQLFGIRTKCLIAEISRSDFLQQMAESRITVFLPKKTEGFYLPSLEGMAMGTFIICPDCGGNRSHCISNFNCLMPDYAEKEIITSVKAALQMDKTSFDKILENATHTAQKHSLENERGQFYEILNKILSIGKNAKNWKLHFEKDDPKWQDLIS
jgi:glycosyltransferase involved in cell wall biosynthesis